MILDTQMLAPFLGWLNFPNLMYPLTDLIFLMSCILLTVGFVIIFNRRKNAAAREAAENLEQFMNTIQDAILLTRAADYQIVAVNPGFTSLSGYTHVEVLGKTTQELKLWTNSAVEPGRLNTLSELGFCENVPVLFCRKDGTQLDGLFSARSITIRGAAHVLSVIQDISSQLQMEKALRESKEKQRILFMDSPDANLLIVDGIFVDCNLEAEKMLGVDRSKIIGQSPDMFSPEYQPDGEKSVESAISKLNETQQKGKLSFDWLHRRLDGSEFLANVSLATITQDGKPAILVIWHDITEQKHTEDALNESRSRINHLLQATDQAIYGVDSSGNCTFINLVGLNVLGYRLQDVLGNHVHTLIHHTREDGTHISERECPIFRTYHTGESCRVENDIFWRKDGTSIPVSYSAHPIIETGIAKGAVVSFADITILRQMEIVQKQKESELKIFTEQLEDALSMANTMTAQSLLAENMVKESEYKLRTIIETSPDGIAITSLEGEVQFVTSKIVTLWGFDTPEEIIGRNLLEFIHPDYHATAIRLITEMINGNLTGAAEYLMIRKDGSQFFAESNGNILRDASDNPIGVLYIARDVTERKRLQEELQIQATTDALTGVTNRRQYLKMAQMELNRTKTNNMTMAIALIDIDHFKSVNDSYGHAAGDLALITFAKKCQENIRGVDSFARIGGDEFALLFPEITAVQALKIVERIRSILTSVVMEYNGQYFKISISSGIASVTAENESFDHLLSRADQALYRAKEAGRNCVMLDG